MDLIRFEVAHKILNEKFGFTEKETELFFLQNRDAVHLSELNESSIVSPNWYFEDDIQRVFDPRLSVIRKAAIDQLTYKQSREYKIVHYPQLKHERMWNPDDHYIQTTLINATKCGLLWYWDEEEREFSNTKTFKAGDKLAREHWSKTNFCIDYIKNPLSFYRLFDIVNIERIIFNKNLDECLKELGLDDSCKERTDC